jgi:hypothetical protein
MAVIGMEAIIGGGGIYSGCKPGEPSLVPDSSDRQN